MPYFSPAQPRQLFHHPALILPRQTLHPRTRPAAAKAASQRFFYYLTRGGWDDPNCARPAKAGSSGLSRLSGLSGWSDWTFTQMNQNDQKDHPTRQTRQTSFGSPFGAGNPYGSSSPTNPHDRVLRI